MQTLTISDAAAAAGVPDARAKELFSSLDPLIAETVEFADQRANAYMQAHIDAATARERLAQLLTVTLDDVAENYEDWVFWMELEQMAEGDEYLGMVVQRQSDAWTNTIRSMLEAAQAEGSVAIELDSDEVAHQLMLMHDSLGRQWTQGLMPPETTRQRVLEELEFELGPAAVRS